MSYTGKTMTTKCSGRSYRNCSAYFIFDENGHEIGGALERISNGTYRCLRCGKHYQMDPEYVVAASVYKGPSASNTEGDK